MELLTIIIISAITSFVVSALFHWFTMTQALNLFKKISDEQERGIEKFFAELKIKLRG